MEHRDGENAHDGSSIKPVSSLRSHFENMIKSKPAGDKPVPPLLPAPRTPLGPPTSGRPWEDSRASQTRGDGRISLDLPRTGAVHASPAHQGQYASNMTPVEEGRQSDPATPKTRPTSMGPLSPPRSPPTVTVDSPRSPPIYSGRTSPTMQSSSSRPRSPASEARHYISRAHSPVGNSIRSFKIPSRAATPALDTSTTPSLPASSSPSTTTDPRKIPGWESPPRGTSSAGGSVPPPINRAGKPKIFQTPPARKASESLAAPAPSSDNQDERVSPFSTPPSEPESPLEEGRPPAIPESSKPRPSVRSPTRERFFSRVSHRNPDFDEPAPEVPSRSTPFGMQSDGHVDKDYTPRTDAPRLPPRREAAPTQIRNRSPKPPHPPPDPPIRRSMDQMSTASTLRATEVPRASLDTHRTLINDNNRILIPPRRSQISGSTAKESIIPPLSRLSHFPPPPPPPRISGETKREPTIPERRSNYQHDSEDEDGDLSPERNMPTLTEYPDSSQANRRPPRFRQRPHEIFTKYETKLFAICGEYVCTTGYVTRVWNVKTAEVLMSLSHGETVKATAVAFKPAGEREDEGKRIWIGTNTGELMEIDIPTQSVVINKISAHSRSPVTKIHRHAAEMWTLDDEGKLLVWPPGEDGSASLEQLPIVSRIPPGSQYCIIVGGIIWAAFGKEILAFQHNQDSHTVMQVTQRPLVQDGLGEVTCGTLVSSQPDRIYFGHNDGRVTIYSRQDHSCLGVINVSLYKISSLVGVGDYLWAGFYTGMIYVYDMSSKPWKVMKDWKAHDGIIAGILVDSTSMWKMDRLQVASLGVDGSIRFWDGMLSDDWLEADMHAHDAEYCDFREVTATVLTWNAGASKPSSLRHDERDANFFREFLRSAEPPDFFVFGFQELVDLEDKKVTAKSFFKKKKKKDNSAETQQHMSHQYRAWRDHLARCLDENMPVEHGYTLLHTANLVGLFTCIFVKSSIRNQIHGIEAAQIKLGMGGLHGNKGALIVRFMLDNSSICFLNCHLAAGQRQTQHRNNDVAAIMEAAPLPGQPDPDIRADSYVGGGDGSMVLDHEICILNGDLNYRIDSMPRDAIISAVKNGNLTKLLGRDQLLLSRERNPGFRLRAFVERPITFAPTYKYDVGSDTYDSSEKKRSPAWCDRVLFRGGTKIRMEEYKRWEVRASDHRPVSGRFKIKVKTVVQNRREIVKAEGERRLEEVWGRVAWDVKLDYLINVFGLSQKEATRLLTKK